MSTDPPLLKLPTEIRLKIYGFLFASSPIRPCQARSNGSLCNQHLTNILAVNRPIHAEALDVFLKEANFVIEISERHVAFLSSMTNTQRFDIFQPPKFIKTIRNVHIEVYMDVMIPNAGYENHKHQLGWILDNIRNVCYALSTNNVLKNLEVSWWHYNLVLSWWDQPRSPQQDMVIPSFFQYSTSFADVARPLIWLSVSGKVDLKAKRAFHRVSGLVEGFQIFMKSRTPAKDPSKLEMDWLELKNWLNDHHFDTTTTWIQHPLKRCLWATNAGDEATFNNCKDFIVDITTRMEAFE